MKLISDIKNLSKQLNSDYFYFLTHPSNLHLLRKSLKEVKKKESNLFFAEFMYDPYYDGIEIRTDKNIPQFAQEWEFPLTPFVDYDKSDESWAIPVGFGRWVEGREPLVYKIKYGDYFKY